MNAIGRLQSTPGLCSATSRLGTQLTILELNRAANIGQMNTCNSYVLGDGAGILLAQITFSDPNLGHLFLQLGHCLKSETYPLEVGFETLNEPECARAQGFLSVGQGLEERILLPQGGSWWINALDTSRDGVQQGTVDVTFGVDAEHPEYRVTGTLQLPIVQVPGDSQP
jgi:hypothetical protein